MNSNANTTSTATSSTNAAQNLPKEKYRSLKKKFKFLVYENECYQEELRNLQRRLLKLSRDKNFLLDRLMQYEKVSDSSDDSDPPAPATKNTSESPKPKPKKKSYPSKKSRAKQPPAAPPTTLPEGGAMSASLIPISTTNVVGPQMISAGRSRKSNANGAGSSSDVEAIVMTTSNTNVLGPIIEMDRMPPHLLSHYPNMGVYEPQLPPPPPHGGD